MEEQLRLLRQGVMGLSLGPGDAPAAPAAPPPVEVVMPQAESATMPPSDAQARANALHGTLEGRLGQLRVRDLARLIEIFSDPREDVLADDRRLVASAVERDSPWSSKTIGQLAEKLGFGNIPLHRVWSQLRPLRNSPTDERAVAAVKVPLQRGAITVAALLDAVRSERLLLSTQRIFTIALKVGARPKHTPAELLEEAAGRAVDERLEPFAVRNVLRLLGAGVDELTVVEVLVRASAIRESRRKRSISEVDIDLGLIAEWLGGKRATATNIRAAVFALYKTPISRDTGRVISGKMAQAFRPLNLTGATFELLRVMKVCGVALGEKEIIHQSLLLAMESMETRMSLTLPSHLAEPRQARMLVSRFTTTQFGTQASAEGAGKEPAQEGRKRRKPRRQ